MIVLNRRISGSERFPFLSGTAEVSVQQGPLPDRSSIHKSTVLFVLLHLGKCNVLCKVLVACNVVVLLY